MAARVNERLSARCAAYDSRHALKVTVPFVIPYLKPAGQPEPESVVEHRLEPGVVEICREIDGK